MTVSLALPGSPGFSGLIGFLGGSGPWEIIIVLALLLLFFGSSRLPKMARSLGSSMTEFKKGLKGGDQDAGDDPKLDASSSDDPDAEAAAGSRSREDAKNKKD